MHLIMRSHPCLRVVVPIEIFAAWATRSRMLMGTTTRQVEVFIVRSKSGWIRNFIGPSGVKHARPKNSGVSASQTNEILGRLGIINIHLTEARTLHILAHFEAWDGILYSHFLVVDINPWWRVHRSTNETAIPSLSCIWEYHLQKRWWIYIYIYVCIYI